MATTGKKNLEQKVNQNSKGRTTTEEEIWICTTFKQK